MPQTKIINFEDDGEGILAADLVINALYENSRLAHVRTGPAYYLAPKLFCFINPSTIAPEVKSILIAFGGADPQNYTDQLLELIQDPTYHKNTSLPSFWAVPSSM